ncbi:MAG: UbiA family prenyltransferase [Verrucomicrobiota bacterium]
MIRPWLELARISNLPTVWTNVTAGWLLTGGQIGSPVLLWMLLAGSLLYTGGMILNDAADVKFDREHRKERPIPSGKVSAFAAWTVGLGMLAAGWCVAVLVAGASIGITTALVGCILFYDLYHKPWSGAVWVMGMCRVLLMLMAALPHNPGCFPRDSWSPSLVQIMALGLGGYIVGLTMVARLESRKGSASSRQRLFAHALLGMPAISYAVILIRWGNFKPLSILADFTPLLLWIVPGVFLLWVTFAMRVMRQGGPAIGRAVGLLLAGIPIVDALSVSLISLPLAFGFVALAPVLRLWQRWIAAT